jgi:RNA polymerase sigma-70 factor (ECF subfamily)
MRDVIEVQLPNVYRFALRLAKGDVHTAEDLTQETLLRAFRNPPRATAPKAIRVWLFRIASNCLTDQARRHQRNSQALKRIGSEQTDASISVEKHFELKEEVDQSLRHLDNLPDRQRSVLYLVACEQLSIDEVADVLQVSTDAVKASLCVARARMRHVMRSDSAKTQNGRPSSTTDPGR